MNVPAWGWYLTIGLMAIALAIDVFIIARRPHVPSMAEAGRALAFYVGLAVLFGLFVWWQYGGQYAGEFYAGWLTEYSLSVDNLFVFILIMSSFRVPAKLQQSALLIGIIIAIVLRGIFIALGAVVINAYSWVFYLFGAFLIYTAIKLARGGESDDDEYHENRFLLFIERRFPATKEWHGTHLTVVQRGKRVVTPMLIVILALGTTDLLFALDSIPAIYGLTKEPYLVLTANIFALMGLRQLYFLIGGLLKRLVYLSIGLAVLLGFIGVKLILHALHENSLPFINNGQPFDNIPEIPILVSLGMIVLILGVTTVASLWKTRRDGRREAASVAATAESSGRTGVNEATETTDPTAS
ncbi:tellurium resistance protein TerC [Intrasporangium oryzae NRRL B-24470]|uniref:Tellurium resistance protein TerC n=1 Tax=Intrasporangium oryzae NRRL B-24470 TaxID=1386089 RepID=W9GDG8_9MICO|nr:TerC family protein [Intrasporangium oryzae]EWT02873.1 tellurium resistance protein TerC [Intrasporangium oryzae NRRL B-24470]